MPMNVDIDTSDLERVERPTPRGLPPLSLDQPLKSPFFVSQFPTTATVSPDAVNNFRNPGIPSYRITPPTPLNLAGSGTNAVPTVAVSTFNILAPPAPTISQSLISIPAGYQFSFYQVQLPLGSQTTISTYKIYRSTTSANTNALTVQTIAHNTANAGVPITIQDAQPNGVTQFYWVSAVSTAGLESSMVPAQSSTVTNNAGFNSSSQLAGTFHNNPVNTSWSPFDSVTLSNNGSVFAITITANTNQFAPGQIHYNSGSVSPPSFGTWVVFADDPTFAGGAPIYNFSSQLQTLAAAEGRLLLGKITTGGSATTGGGFSGGTGGPSFAGGRGLIQI
jgi:hypothetical protein